MNNFLGEQKNNMVKIIKKTKLKNYNDIDIDSVSKIDDLIEDAKKGTEEEIRTLICYLESTIDEQLHSEHIYQSHLIALLIAFASSIFTFFFNILSLFFLKNNIKNNIQVEINIIDIVTNPVIIFIIAYLVVIFIFYKWSRRNLKSNIIKKYTVSRLKIVWEQKKDEQRIIICSR